MCMEVKSKYYQQYVKNPQLRTSTFYLLHPQILSAKIICILPIATSARPHFTTGRKWKGWVLSVTLNSSYLRNIYGHIYIVRVLFFLFLIHKNNAVVANALSSEQSSILWSRTYKKNWPIKIARVTWNICGEKLANFSRLVLSCTIISRLRGVSR